MWRPRAPPGPDPATQANGKAERAAAAVMLGDVHGDTQRITVGAAKTYGICGFVQECRAINVTPHVAQNLKRSGGRAIDARTTVGQAQCKTRTPAEPGWPSATCTHLATCRFAAIRRVDATRTVVLLCFNDFLQ